jgi:thioesterase-3
MPKNIGRQLIVRGYHCDAYGHVNNATYLQFLEEGRWHFLQPSLDTGFFEKKGLIFVVVHISIHFKKPLFPNDKIYISLETGTYNNKSIIVKQYIKCGNDICSEADITFVLLNKKDMRPATIDEDIKDEFNRLFKIQNEKVDL